MKVILVSFITSSNIGDQLIVKTLSEQLLKKYDVIKYSYNIESESNISLVSNKKKNTLLKKIYLNYLRKLPLIDKFRDRVNKRKIDKNPNWKKFINELSEADLIIFGGGNAIFDLTKYSSSYYSFNKIVDIARQMNKVVFASSIGIGPFVTEQQIEKANEALAKCDYITVRDEKSYSYLKFSNDKKYLSVDPVFSLDEVDLITNKSNTIKIGICIIDLMNNKQTIKENDRYIEDMASLISKMTKQNNYEIYLFSSEPRDYGTVLDVYKHLKNISNIKYTEINTIDNLMSLYSTLDLVLGARMHSLIVAISQNIPVIGFSWQPKVVAMFETINDKESVFNISSIKENEDQILQTVQVKLNDPQKDKKMYTLKNELNEKFNINYDILNIIENKIENK